MQDCCHNYALLNLTRMTGPFSMVYWDDPSLWSAAGAIVITPLYWILVSQLEWRTHVLRRLFCSRYIAVFIFAISLCLMISYRNMKFIVAIQNQRKWSTLQENPILWVGHTFTLVGLLLVIRSFLSLGFISTFMGDYFDLCLPRRVTKFPYSWMNHPMYTGSFLMFLGAAIVDTSQAGLVLALLAGLMYLLAAWWEEPYTDGFYVTYPVGTRTVGVQVCSSTQLLEIAARTVATQTGGDVDVIGTGFMGLDVDIDVDEEDLDAEAGLIKEDGELDEELELDWEEEEELDENQMERESKEETGGMEVKLDGDEAELDEDVVDLKAEGVIPAVEEVEHEVKEAELEQNLTNDRAEATGMAEQLHDQYANEDEKAFVDEQYANEDEKDVAEEYANEDEKSDVDEQYANEDEKKDVAEEYANEDEKKDVAEEHADTGEQVDEQVESSASSAKEVHQVETVGMVSESDLGNEEHGYSLANHITDKRETGSETDEQTSPADETSESIEFNVEKEQEINKELEAGDAGVQATSQGAQSNTSGVEPSTSGDKSNTEPTGLGQPQPWSGKKKKVPTATLR